MQGPERAAGRPRGQHHHQCPQQGCPQRLRGGDGDRGPSRRPASHRSALTLASMGSGPGWDGSCCSVPVLPPPGVSWQAKFYSRPGKHLHGLQKVRIIQKPHLSEHDHPFCLHLPWAEQTGEQSLGQRISRQLRVPGTELLAQRPQLQLPRAILSSVPRKTSRQAISTSSKRTREDRNPLTSRPSSTVS